MWIAFQAQARITARQLEAIPQEFRSVRLKVELEEDMEMTCGAHFLGVKLRTVVFIWAMDDCASLLAFASWYLRVCSLVL